MPRPDEVEEEAAECTTFQGAMIHAVVIVTENIYVLGEETDQIDGAGDGRTRIDCPNWWTRLRSDRRKRRRRCGRIDCPISMPGSLKPLISNNSC
jgi:hypothetical protein